MSYITIILKIVACLAVAIGLSACAKKVAKKVDTMHICDESGCRDHPKGYSSFNPAGEISEDAEKIAALEQLAAKDPRAAYDLALRFFRGDGVRQDLHQSIKWMRDAGERGDLDAQKALGRLYLTGMAEMGADYAEAQKWLSITASRGDKEATTFLNEATAARKSEVEQYRWYSRWRPIFYNYWYSGYAYRWNWGNAGWYLYY